MNKTSQVSTTASRHLRNLLQAFAMVSLFKMINIVVIFAFSSSLKLHCILFVSHSSVPLPSWLEWSCRIHRLPLCRRVRPPQQVSRGSVGWGCRIYRLHLYSGVRHPQRVPWIWHKTIYWWGSSDAGALVNVEHPFIAIAPRSILGRSGSILC